MEITPHHGVGVEPHCKSESSMLPATTSSAVLAHAKNPEGAVTEVITLSGFSTRLVLQP